MKKFEEYVEQLAEKRAEKLRQKANLALQASLRERTDEEVYAHIYRTLGVSAQKALAVLS